MLPVSRNFGLFFFEIINILLFKYLRNFSIHGAITLTENISVVYEGKWTVLHSNVAASKPNAECTTNHNANFIIIPSEMLQFSQL